MESSEWISEYAGQLEKIREKLLSLYADYIFEKNSREGLTHVQTVLLMYLLDKDSSTVSEIADYMGVTMAAASSLVDRLVKGGLLYRIRSESDRRVVYISHTPMGREVIEKSIVRRRKRVEKLISKMGKENADLYTKAQKILLETLELLVKEKNEQEASDGI